MYEVIVSRIDDKGPEGARVELYRQTVEELSLPKIITAVNSKPRKPRAPRTPTPAKP